MTKKFLCVWGEGYSPTDEAIVQTKDETFFCEDNGYWEDDLVDIRELRTGDCQALTSGPAGGERHSVVRIL